MIAPGRYQSFVWSASDIARQAKIGAIAAARGELDRDEWPDPGNRPEPEWEQMPETQRWRRETTITTYTICSSRLQLANYPAFRFGPAEYEVFTLD